MSDGLNRFSVFGWLTDKILNWNIQIQMKLNQIIWIYWCFRFSIAELTFYDVTYDLVADYFFLTSSIFVKQFPRNGVFKKCYTLQHLLFSMMFVIWWLCCQRTCKCKQTALHNKTIVNGIRIKKIHVLFELHFHEIKPDIVFCSISIDNTKK